MGHRRRGWSCHWGRPWGGCCSWGCPRCWFTRCWIGASNTLNKINVINNTILLFFGVFWSFHYLEYFQFFDISVSLIFQSFLIRSVLLTFFIYFILFSISRYFQYFYVFNIFNTFYVFSFFKTLLIPLIYLIAFDQFDIFSIFHVSSIFIRKSSICINYNYCSIFVLGRIFQSCYPSNRSISHENDKQGATVSSTS